MNSLMNKAAKLISFALRVTCTILTTFFLSFSANAELSQSPLFLGESVPGLLVLTPSVEWPTIDSNANQGSYTVATEYAGYFDPKKCYDYVYSATETDRYFKPVSITSTRTCSGKWSGNFLNWAATQTIDPFRSALTGGYRVKDTPTETWLEKARQDGQGGYPILSLSTAALVSGATPFTQNSMTIRIQGLQNKMWFGVTCSTSCTTLNNSTSTAVPLPSNFQDYNPATATTSGNTNKIYMMSIRVKVCDPAVGLEPNCRQYAQGWKPEGLIQKYAKEMRYSIFGYLNDSDILRDGGILRASSKFVGPILPDAVGTANANKEWDPSTGVLIQNPNPADATNTSTANNLTGDYLIRYSGVINYLNRFGQMTGQNHKSYDPVSELYYSAIRYLKNLGNVPQYTTMSSSATALTKYNMADAFPVITTWPDPIQNWCQKNIILGIGDVNSHRDKNLPSATATGNANEPTKPTLVANDKTVDVNKATAKVAALEGITINNNPFSGRENSAYIVGLAYDSHTKDLRPDLPGVQTVSTYWVDVLENQTLLGISSNQYWLAAKYGGFKVPPNFDPYATATTSIPLNSWYTNGEKLVVGAQSGTNATLNRPDNYFTAGNANNMVKNLTTAFGRIASELKSASATAVSTNSTKIEGGSLVYQAKFDPRDWTGQLIAYIANADGTLGAAKWSTDDADTAGPLSFKVAATGTNGYANRKIYTTTSKTTGVNFSWSSLTNVQQGYLTDTLVSGQNRLNWIRGDISQEGAPLRSRNKILENGKTIRAILGDVINSNPALFNGTLYVGANDGMLHAFNADTGVEQFAFIPNAVFPNLAKLTDPNYTHQYFVDGSPTVSNAVIKGAAGSVLVGTLGAGGRAVFALDVSNPATFDATKVLWEFGATDDPDLGYMVGQMSPSTQSGRSSVVGQLKDGTWVAIFGNGYESKIQINTDLTRTDNSKAYLYVVKLDDGSVLQKIEAPTSSSPSANGLSAPTLQLDNDKKIVAAYAGDLQGNLWKFDLTGSGSAQRLFTAVNAAGKVQPITASPEIAFHPISGYLVYFGTGQYMMKGDHTVEVPVQSLYGIWDEDGTATSRSQLLKQEITNVSNANGNNWRFVTNNPINWTAHQGWYLDLPSQGERVTDKPMLNFGRAMFTTRIPNTSADPCDASTGTSWFMALDMLTGGQPDETVFDVNRDRQFNDADKVNGKIAIGFETGAAGMSRVTLVISERGVDVIVSGVSNTTTTAQSYDVTRDAAAAVAAIQSAIVSAVNSAANATAAAAAVAAIVASAADTATAKANASGVDPTVANYAKAAAAAAKSGDVTAAKAAAAAAVAAASQGNTATAAAAAAAVAAAVAAAAAADIAANPSMTIPNLVTRIPTIIASVFNGLVPTVIDNTGAGVAMSAPSRRGSWRQLR